MSDLTPAEMSKEMLRLSRKIDAGVDYLADAIAEYAAAESDYRKLKAQVWVEVAAKSDMLAAHREAEVDSRTADARQRRDVAEGMKRAATESIRARQAQLSALQSLMSAHRAEAEFARTGPQ